MNVTIDSLVFILIPILIHVAVNIYVSFASIGMAPKPKRTARNHNHDDNPSNEKKVKTCDNGEVGCWSDLNHHLVYIIMMQLGVIDYLSFSGVCKSWRSLANSNKKKFMATKPPMTLHVNWRAHAKLCYLEDFEGRKFKTFLPPFAGGTCVGLTCGYLIFFVRAHREFRLVNPITRHQLHFPGFPLTYLEPSVLHVRAILVFSRSIRRWVLLVIKKCESKIWFSMAGKGKWDDASFDSVTFTDLRAFNGIIYTLNVNYDTNLCELHELRLNPDPELILVEAKNALKRSRYDHEQELVSSGENIYVMDCLPPIDDTDTMEDAIKYRYVLYELDFGEMKWVSRVKTIGECAPFLSNFKHGVAVTSPFWGMLGQGLLLGHSDGDVLERIHVEKTMSSFAMNMWYFPHECLNVDRVDD
ncbi:hypothetical protein LXL04_026781 [Taraxacum kok-saghyz]